MAGGRLEPEIFTNLKCLQDMNAFTAVNINENLKILSIIPSLDSFTTTSGV